MGNPGMDEMRGRTLGGRFEIRDHIGRGGMSDVYSARDHKLGKSACAIKILSPALATHPSARKRFLREARNAARVGHPNVVRIIDVADDDDATPYIAMELIRGRSLRVLLTESRHLEWRRAAELVRQIASGLQAAHDVGIVHRDVKPDNVIVWNDLAGGHVELIDFGIATAVLDTRISLDGVAVGTARYMAPEQLLNPLSIDARVDVYALGVVAYELLAGVAPFDLEDYRALTFAIVNQPPPPLRASVFDAPGGLVDLVHSCLGKEPDDRPANMREIIDALDGLLRDADGPWKSPVQPRWITPPHPSLLANVRPQWITPVPPAQLGRGALSARSSEFLRDAPQVEPTTVLPPLGPAPRAEARLPSEPGMSGGAPSQSLGANETVAFPTNMSSTGRIALIGIGVLVTLIAAAGLGAAIDRYTAVPEAPAEKEAPAVAARAGDPQPESQPEQPPKPEPEPALEIPDEKSEPGHPAEQIELNAAGGADMVEPVPEIGKESANGEKAEDVGSQPRVTEKRAKDQRARAKRAKRQPDRANGGMVPTASVSKGAPPPAPVTAKPAEPTKPKPRPELTGDLANPFRNARRLGEDPP